MFELGAYEVRKEAAAWKVYKASQTVATTVDWFIADNCGPVNLAEKFPDTSEITPKLVLRDLRTARAREHWVGATVDAEQGLLSFPDVQPKSGPGILFSHVILENQEGKPVLVDCGYLDVEGKIRKAGTRPIGILDVRMALMDLSPEWNVLLDALEFEDGTIAYALQRPIDLWNETPPNLGPLTQSTFPYRENWLRATCGYLLKTAAHLFRRNTLSYQAGGLSISDQNKEQDYLKEGARLVGEYEQWIVRKKYELNLNHFYGGIGSAFGR